MIKDISIQQVYMKLLGEVKKPKWWTPRDDWELMDGKVANAIHLNISEEIWWISCM
jgi:hypothetical protein